MIIVVIVVALLLAGIGFVVLRASDQNSDE